MHLKLNPKTGETTIKLMVNEKQSLERALGIVKGISQFATDDDAEEVALGLASLITKFATEKETVQ